MEVSALQKARYAYKPKVPAVLSLDPAKIAVSFGGPTESVADQAELKALFPATYGKPLATFVEGKEKNEKVHAKKNVGVILSGGQAPGGHNVIAGLFDGLKRGNSESRLYGFLDGPAGIIDGKYIEITAGLIDRYRNTGGFDLIGSGRTKIETPEQFASSLKTAKKLALSAVVIIGGDDSNTNAAVLAEYFLAQKADCVVIGCPKTIDGDLKNEYIEASFGFDTAVKTYSELVGNIERDAASSKKYWHFIRLMGRSASHIALECALQAQPNVCLIGEEIAAKNMSMGDIVDSIVDSVVKRADKGLNFGVVLVPEGIVEFVPQMKALIAELNDLLAKTSTDIGTAEKAAAEVQGQAPFSDLATFEERTLWLSKKLSKQSAALFTSLPSAFAAQLLAERDPHGNVQVSLIESEKLFISMVKARLAVLKEQGTYKGKFSALAHFFGYEGRCAFPSNFDADYCYSLGLSASLLIAEGLTGYISSVRNLTAPADQWQAGGVPLTMMMNMEQRLGKKKPVIKKALVELNGRPFKRLEENRARWAVETCYQYPGAIQYFGPCELADRATITLGLEH